MDAPPTRAAGAYELEVELPEGMEVILRGRAWHLPPGRYVYCGSAHGPGGIAARVGRHLRTDKVCRWHIDRLTAAAPVVVVRAYPGGRECDLVSAWRARGATVEIPGFGSSDCRRCPAHLLRLPRGGQAAAQNR